MSLALQIDPGYEGHLVAAIKNEGKTEIEFELHKTLIFSVEFYALTSAPTRKLMEIRRPESFPSIRENLSGLKFQIN